MFKFDVIVQSILGEGHELALGLGLALGTVDRHCDGGGRLHPGACGWDRPTKSPQRRLER